MRRLNQIVSSTPIVTASQYDSQLFNEYADCSTINLLASVTQSLDSIQTLVDDFKVINQNSAVGRKHGGVNPFGALPSHAIGGAGRRGRSGYM